MKKTKKSNTKSMSSEELTGTTVEGEIVANTQQKTKIIQDIGINFPKNPTIVQRILSKLILGITWVKIEREILDEE